MDRRGHPTTRTVKASEARQNWSSVLDTVFRAHTRVLIEKSGIPVAAVVSTEDLERLNRLDAEQAQWLKVLDASQAAFAGIPDDELERELERAREQVRAEQREQQRAGARP